MNEPIKTALKSKELGGWRMKREEVRRITEYAEKEVDFIIGNLRVIKENRKLLKQIIILEKILNRYCFIESSQHLKAAKYCMVRDLKQ